MAKIYLAWLHIDHSRISICNASIYLPQRQIIASLRGNAPECIAWVEKYRPKTIEDVSSQEHTVAVLRKTLLSTNVSLPHVSSHHRLVNRYASLLLSKSCLTCCSMGRLVRERLVCRSNRGTPTIFSYRLWIHRYDLSPCQTAFRVCVIPSLNNHNGFD